MSLATAFNISLSPIPVARLLNTLGNPNPLASFTRPLHNAAIPPLSIAFRL